MFPPSAEQAETSRAAIDQRLFDALLEGRVPRGDSERVERARNSHPVQVVTPARDCIHIEDPTAPRQHQPLDRARCGMDEFAPGGPTRLGFVWVILPAGGLQEGLLLQRVLCRPGAVVFFHGIIHASGSMQWPPLDVEENFTAAFGFPSLALLHAGAVLRRSEREAMLLPDGAWCRAEPREVEACEAEHLVACDVPIHHLHHEVLQLQVFDVELEARVPHRGAAVLDGNGALDLAGFRDVVQALLGGDDSHAAVGVWLALEHRQLIHDGAFVLQPLAALDCHDQLPDGLDLEHLIHLLLREGHVHARDDDGDADVVGECHRLLQDAVEEVQEYRAEPGHQVDRHGGDTRRGLDLDAVVDVRLVGEHDAHASNNRCHREDRLEGDVQGP
mmetsp:Transcript_58140/g.185006  ORF Transcript_58140/g.185006 Transcript_58140/m.185006 type:complete len:388 (+) Transcript_58140:3190-4353(+)